MSDSSDSHSHAHEEAFSVPLFLATVAGSLTFLFLTLKFAAPGVWSAQWSAPLWMGAVAFGLISLVNCFMEFFFHRYVLHKPAIPLLKRFYRQHTLHHNLTRIARRRTPGGRDVPFVENRFPITEPEQGEASFFPWYTLVVFAAALTPLLALLHWAFPAIPWFAGGFIALTSSLMLYELLHAVEHWPFETWGPLIEHPRWGWFWRRVYSFHLRHHAVIDCNEAISGFFGLPVADWVFGTCIIPKTLYADGQEWTPSEFKSPQPCAFIRWLDRKAEQTVQAQRAHRAAAAHTGSESQPPLVPVVRPYTRGEELAHALTHGAGLIGSIVALSLLVVFSSVRGDAWHVVSFTVFGLTLLLLYTASTLYHSVKSPNWKRRFRRFDHAAVFLLIAGTYTPFLLTSLRGPWGWTLFGIVWGLCAAGAVSQFISDGKYKSLRTLVCLAVGWLIVVAIKPLIATVPDAGLWLLVAGGVCYTVGAVFYLWRQMKYHHAVWHGFVLGGSTCHLLAVFFLLPAAGSA